MTCVAVLTTDGDAPGINAAIRAAVRTGIDRGWEMFGVRHGYAGLVKNALGLRDVGSHPLVIVITECCGQTGVFDTSRCFSQYSLRVGL